MTMTYSVHVYERGELPRYAEPRERPPIVFGDPGKSFDRDRCGWGTETLDEAERSTAAYLATNTGHSGGVLRFEIGRFCPLCMSGIQPGFKRKRCEACRGRGVVPLSYPKNVPPEPKNEEHDHSTAGWSTPKNNCSVRCFLTRCAHRCDEHEAIDGTTNRRCRIPGCNCLFFDHGPTWLKVADLNNRSLAMGDGQITLVVARHRSLDCQVVEGFREGSRESSSSSVGTLSVAVHELVLAPDEICIKTHPATAELVKAALATDWFEPTDRRVELGFCIAEVWRLVR